MVTDSYGPSISKSAPPFGKADSCSAVWELSDEEADVELTSEAALEEERTVKEEMEVAEEKVDNFAKVHFRSMIGIKFLGLMALAALLTVEWISELRSNESQRVIELTGLGKDVQLFDLVLTSSARLLALTGDVAYRDSYFMKLEPLEDAMRGIELQAPEIATRFNQLTVVANDKLVAIETEALDLIGSNRSRATELLFSPDYKSNKALLSAGLQELDELITASRRSHEQTQQWWTYLSTSVVLAAFVSEVMLVVVVHRLDNRLELLSLANDVAQNRYELLMRKGLLNVAGETLQLLEIARSKKSLQKQMSVPTIKEERTPRLIMRRRLFILSMMAELLALTGFAIPASLTLIALNNAASAEPIQELLLHAKSTEYFDMALTTSAQLCVLTGDQSWLALYDGYIAPMDAALLGLQEVAPDISSSFAAATATANDLLIEMETVALNYCAPGRQEGVDVLFSSAYRGNKTVLLQGIEDVTRAAETALQEHEDHSEDHTNLARVLLITSTFLIVAADLCTVVIAAWMEALSVTQQKDLSESEVEIKFMRHLLSLIQINLQSNRRVKSLPIEKVDVDVDL